jgi:transposase-like protein
MKKHTQQEILLKLAHADELMRVGKSQGEVCNALGVSVMTFHRWRKRVFEKDDVNVSRTYGAEPARFANPPTMEDMRRLLQELTDENRRLRRIVTDLLLEKVRLQEASP